MFAVEIYEAVRSFVFIKGNSRREAVRVFGLSRETVLKMCRFSLPPGLRNQRHLHNGLHADRDRQPQGTDAHVPLGRHQALKG